MGSKYELKDYILVCGGNACSYIDHNGIIRLHIGSFTESEAEYINKKCRVEDPSREWVLHNE